MARAQAAAAAADRRRRARPGRDCRCRDRGRAGDDAARRTATERLCGRDAGGGRPRPRADGRRPRAAAAVALRRDVRAGGRSRRPLPGADLRRGGRHSADADRCSRLRPVSRRRRARRRAYARGADGEGHRRIRFRLPTGADQEAAARSSRAKTPPQRRAAGIRLRAATCGTSAASPSTPTGPSSPKRSARPMRRSTRRWSCRPGSPARAAGIGSRPCSTASPWRAPPSRAAERLFGEVDRLARAYHWSEAEILALPRGAAAALPRPDRRGGGGGMSGFAREAGAPRRRALPAGAAGRRARARARVAVRTANAATSARAGRRPPAGRSRRAARGRTASAPQAAGLRRMRAERPCTAHGRQVRSIAFRRRTAECLDPAPPPARPRA